MNYCSKCVMPDTKPGVTLDERGYCNACRSQEYKREIDWDQRDRELREMCDKIRESNSSTYDCLVPVSGGKNGWYQA